MLGILNKKLPLRESLVFFLWSTNSLCVTKIDITRIKELYKWKLAKYFNQILSNCPISLFF